MLEKPASMYPPADIERGRFNIVSGRVWADLLTPMNFYRMNVTHFGLDVIVQAACEVVPGVVIYPQIMAASQFSGHRPRNRDGVYDGPPSLIVEIFGGDEPWEELVAQSQALLAQAGVPEYIAVAEGLRWFRLEDGAYVRVEPDEEGFIRSSTMPGFWFNLAAHKERDYQRVFAGIVQGIESELEERYQAIYRP